MISIRQQFHFEAGHRLLRHQGKCQYLHGHNYTVEVTLARADGPDPLGMVADFSLVKALVGGWLARHWDHCFLLHQGDAEALAAVSRVNPPDKIYLLDRNPTAEGMAAHLLAVLPSLFPPDINVLSVRVEETPGCSAEARNE